MSFTHKGKRNLKVGVLSIICVLLVMRKEEGGREQNVLVENVSDAGGDITQRQASFG